MIIDTFNPHTDLPANSSIRLRFLKDQDPQNQLFWQKIHGHYICHAMIVRPISDIDYSNTFKQNQIVKCVFDTTVMKYIAHSLRDPDLKFSDVSGDNAYNFHLFKKPVPYSYFDDDLNIPMAYHFNESYWTRTKTELDDTQKGIITQAIYDEDLPKLSSYGYDEYDDLRVMLRQEKIEKVSGSEPDLITHLKEIGEEKASEEDGLIPSKKTTSEILALLKARQRDSNPTFPATDQDRENNPTFNGQLNEPNDGNISPTPSIPITELLARLRQKKENENNELEFGLSSVDVRNEWIVKNGHGKWMKTFDNEISADKYAEESALNNPNEWYSVSKTTRKFFFK